MTWTPGHRVTVQELIDEANKMLPSQLSGLKNGRVFQSILKVYAGIMALHFNELWEIADAIHEGIERDKKRGRIKLGDMVVTPFGIRIVEEVSEQGVRVGDDWFTVDQVELYTGEQLKVRSD